MTEQPWSHGRAIRPSRQPPTPDAWVVGVDIGGTSTSAVLLDAVGVVRARQRATTPAGAGADGILAVVADLVHTVDPDRWAEQVGVGATGVVDPADGTVVAATASMPGWSGTNLPSRLAPVLRRQVVAVNDVHAFVVGEARAGAAVGAQHVLGVTVGTGVGGAVLIEGRLLGGRKGAAGHVGHVPVPAAAGLRCPCGAVGHVEAVAAAPALMAAYRARVAGRQTSGVGDLEQVARLAEEGDRDAIEVLAEGGRSLGEALAGVVAVVSPDVVVLGGGVLDAGVLVLDPLRAALAVHAHPVVADVPVRSSLLGADAVAVGAALHARGVLS